MVTVVFVVTGAVGIVKEADDWFAKMLTVCGGWACGSLLVTITVKPNAEAGALSISTPVTGFPPVTVAGVRVRLVNCADPGGFTARDTFCVTPE